MNKALILAAAVAATTTACTSAPSLQPSDPRATTSTATLYKNMISLATRGTMIGHQDALAYGVGWYGDADRCDFRDASGDYPAVFGWEVGEIELGADRSLDSVYFERIRADIRRAYDLGGINTISWHARNPLTGGDAWDVTSSDAVASILPGGANHTRYLGWLDILSDFMLSLRDGQGELIPVIFRPFHELTGNWFWWGNGLCTPQEYITLWRTTAEYMRSRGVHHLLWAYSTAGYTNAEEFLERYPGDEWVDLMGFDAYQHATGEEFAKQVAGQTRLLVQIASQHKKIAALTELGCEGLTDSTWYSRVLYPLLKGQGLSYVLLWRNAYDRPGHFYASHPGHASAEDLKRFIAQEDVLTAAEIGTVYQ